MRRDERIVLNYLESLNVGEVVFEPDGKVPPDFLIDGRIAIEARRLSQHYAVEGTRRALEEDTIPLRHSLDNLLSKYGAGDRRRSWFVMFSYRRPLVDWKDLRGANRGALNRFVALPSDTQTTIQINKAFRITLLRSENFLGSTFVYGGHNDGDAGGWLVSEIVRNVSAYISEKSEKVAAFKHRYQTWWLILVDYIGTPSEGSEVRKRVRCPEGWNRVVILSHEGRAYGL